MKKVWKAGYTEKQVTLANGTLLNYGESPDENNEKTPTRIRHSGNKKNEIVELISGSLI